MNRRKLFAGAATLALPHALAAQSSAFDVDVVVVGAGPAGLAAARELRALGKSFVVLEARDRIGGRVFTETSLGAPYDAGAVYIHWGERNPWREEAARFGVEAVEEGTLPRGKFRFFENGVESDRGRNRRAFWAGLSEQFDVEVGPVPDVSFVERIKDHPEMERGAIGMARLGLGEEAERVSALDYARLWSGDDLVMPRGYGSLVASFGADIPVRRSTPARAIDWSGPGVRVMTDAGTISAKASIVTVPVGVLASGAIRFTPELPSDTRDGLGGLGMGALTKAGLSFGDARFDLPANSSLWDSLGPRAGFAFDCFAYDQNVVVAYFGGDHARELLHAGERQTLALLLERFVNMVGSDARKSFVGGRVHGWCTDPWSMGCYSVARPGQAGAREKLARPVAERLWFAGEATAAGDDGSFGAAMTAGGAYLAGVAAARAAAKA